MSYNTDLQNNNTSLEEILETVNALPEAGSGSGGDNILDIFSRDTFIAKNNDLRNLMCNHPLNLYVSVPINSSSFGEDVYLYPVDDSQNSTRFTRCYFEGDIKICCDFGLPSGNNTLFIECEFSSDTTVYVPWGEGEYTLYENATVDGAAKTPNTVYNYTVTD